MRRRRGYPRSCDTVTGHRDWELTGRRHRRRRRRRRNSPSLGAFHRRRGRRDSHRCLAECRRSSTNGPPRFMHPVVLGGCTTLCTPCTLSASGTTTTFGRGGCDLSHRPPDAQRVVSRPRRGGRVEVRANLAPAHRRRHRRRLQLGQPRGDRLAERVRSVHRRRRRRRRTFRRGVRVRTRGIVGRGGKGSTTPGSRDEQNVMNIPGRQHENSTRTGRTDHGGGCSRRQQRQRRRRRRRRQQRRQRVQRCGGG